MTGQLSTEKREKIIKWKGEIEKGIQRKEFRVEELKREIEWFKFKIDTYRPVKDLIKNAMTEKIILKRGIDISCDPKTLDQCMNKSEEEKGELEEQSKDKIQELSNLWVEIIVDYQKLIVLKKDLEESGYTPKTGSRRSA